MAESLDDFLQPGEQVLWRDPKPRLLDDWSNVLGGALLFTGIGFAMVGRFGLEVWVIVFGVVLAFCTVFELTGRFLPWLNRRVDTVLTTGRLLHCNDWADGDLVEIPLAEVAGIALSWTDRLTLSKRGGGTIGLNCMRQPQALATALAGATGLPPPRLVGRLAGLWDKGQELGTPICFFLLVVLLPKWFVLERGAEPGIVEAAPLLLSMMALWCVAFLFGPHLFAVLCLVVLRPWASPAEARTWLDLAAERGKSERAWERVLSYLFLWRSPLYAWLVRLLWGAPMNGPNAEVTGHG